ncbi:MAG: sigma-70 family RNA polymerase sigma factor [Nakamurella sp.]
MNAAAPADPSRARGTEDVLSVARRLFGPARALLGAGPEAEDLVYDTIASLYPRWNQISGNKLAYARRALTNRFLDQQRHLQVKLAHQSELATPARLEGPYITIDTIVDVQRALMHLPARTRSVVVLRYLLDQPARQVGDRLGIPSGTVRRLAHDGLHQLSSLLMSTTEGPSDDR